MQLQTSTGSLHSSSRCMQQRPRHAVRLPGSSRQLQQLPRRTTTTTQQLPQRGARTRPRVAMPDVAQQQQPPAFRNEQQQQQDDAQEVTSSTAGHAAAAEGSNFTPITAMWPRLAATLGSQEALLDPHRCPPVSTSYAELHQLILDFAAGLAAAGGLAPGERVALFAESSPRWIVADQGILVCGAADAVRGSTSPVDELAFILGHSQASGLVLQDAATLARLLPAIRAAQQGGQGIRFVAVLWDQQQQPSTTAAAPPATTNGSSSSSSVMLHEAADQLPGAAVLGYDAVLAAGRAARAAGDAEGTEGGAGFRPPVLRRSDLATLVYTSGTTGRPKGVMLSHGNLAYQVENLAFFLPVAPGDASLSLLPPWHIYQRSAAYYLFSRGARTVFTSLAHFRADLAAHPPDHFVCVPLVLDTLYNKIMSKLASEARGAKGALVSALLRASYAFVSARRVLAGTDLAHARAPPSPVQRVLAAATCALLAPVYALARRLVFSKVAAALGIKQTIISGGGSLAAHLDLFFEAAGLTVLNGWGLTETSPVLACRRPSANVRGSVGHPTPGTQVVVVDPATHARLPDGQQGLLLAAGPGVMQGYWRDPDATAAAFVDGWFNTGDLGWRAPGGVAGSAMAGAIVLSGRAKDTLVLLSGKNIEPQPIEDALCRSPLIKHVVLLGQDKRELGALVFPDEEALAARGLSGGDDDDGKLAALLAAEVASLNAARPEYHPEDHVAHVAVMRAPLSVEAGTLTRTMKPRRGAIQEAHAAEVAALLARLRG